MTTGFSDWHDGRSVFTIRALGKVAQVACEESDDRALMILSEYLKAQKELYRAEYICMN